MPGNAPVQLARESDTVALHSRASLLSSASCPSHPGPIFGSVAYPVCCRFCLVLGCSSHWNQEDNVLQALDICCWSFTKCKLHDSSTHITPSSCYYHYHYQLPFRQFLCRALKRPPLRSLPPASLGFAPLHMIPRYNQSVRVACGRPWGLAATCVECNVRRASHV